MSVLPLVEAAEYFPPRGALVGLDLGTKTIGVAVSDPDRKLATGVTTVARSNFTADARRVLALAAERSACGFVLGLPINMDGSEGPRAQSTRAFARNFSKLTHPPISLWGEPRPAPAGPPFCLVARPRSVAGAVVRRCRRLSAAGRIAAVIRRARTVVTRHGL